MGYGAGFEQAVHNSYLVGQKEPETETKKRCAYEQSAIQSTQAGCGESHRQTDSSGDDGHTDDRSDPEDGEVDEAENRARNRTENQ